MPWENPTSNQPGQPKLFDSMLNPRTIRKPLIHLNHVARRGFCGPQVTIRQQEIFAFVSLQTIGNSAFSSSSH